MSRDREPFSLILPYRDCSFCIVAESLIVYARTYRSNAPANCSDTQDINIQNFMTNCYYIGPVGRCEDALRDHRKHHQCTYCLFDFDLSCQFPLDTPLSRCRLNRDALPISNTRYNPSDLDLGQYDYNPLAYDVANLGNFFKFQFGVRHNTNLH